MCWKCEPGGFNRKTRLIYVKGADDKNRHPKMQALVRKAGNQLIRRRFTTTSELIREVYASLVESLEGRGMLHSMPFDDSLCPGPPSGTSRARPSDF